MASPAAACGSYGFLSRWIICVCSYPIGGTTFLYFRVNFGGRNLVKNLPQNCDQKISRKWESFSTKFLPHFTQFLTYTDTYFYILFWLKVYSAPHGPPWNHWGIFGWSGDFWIFWGPILAPNGNPKKVDFGKSRIFGVRENGRFSGLNMCKIRPLNRSHFMA